MQNDIDEKALWWNEEKSIRLTADERYHCSISWFRYKNKRELTKRIFMYSVDYLSSIVIILF